MMDEIQLPKVVELIDEELQIARVFGEDQAAPLSCDGIVMHEQVENAVRDRIAANITHGESNTLSPFPSKRPAEFFEVAGGVTRVGKCHE